MITFLCPKGRKGETLWKQMQAYLLELMNQQAFKKKGELLWQF